MVEALCKEIDLKNNYLSGDTIHTVYIGGGTPSLLNVDELRSLIEKLKLEFAIAEDAEITIEVNPDDITTEKLSEWHNAGINRLSIGIQSFFEDELRWMNRAHTAEQATKSLELATEHFNNISIDLIYGSPLLTEDMWQQNVQTALSFNIPHLSCYALTVEDKTPLHKQIVKSLKSNIDSDKQARHFLLLMKWMQQGGYEHYEISNFAKLGFRSRHNSSYWNGEKYLGVGPSAHSFNGNSRQWNIANNQIYIKNINSRKVPYEVELLTQTQQLNEYIMISLRTSEGMNLAIIEEKWGTNTKKEIQDKLEVYRSNLYFKGSKVHLTNEGKLIADGIAAALFN